MTDGILTGIGLVIGVAAGVVAVLAGISASFYLSFYWQEWKPRIKQWRGKRSEMVSDAGNIP